MKKNLVILCDDNEHFEIISERMAFLLKTAGFPDYEVMWCRTEQQFTDALQQHGERLRCLLLDERPSASDLPYGSYIAHRLRRGDYGEMMKTIPAAIISAGDMPVLGAYPPVYIIDKEDLTLKFDNGNLLHFIQNGSPKDIISSQAARNHNAEMLAGILSANKGGRLDLVHACQPADRQIVTIAEGIIYLHELFSYAFTNGTPGKEELHKLQAALNTRRLYIEDDNWAMRFSALIEKINRAVNNNIGRSI